VHAYKHASGCRSITGGTFVPAGARWPTAYDGAYLFGDFICNQLFLLSPGGNVGLSRSVFDPDFLSPIAMRFGPDGGGQALYYASFAEGGKIGKIVATVP